MDESWMVRMRVDQLQMGRRQPFYHVLVEDGTTRYAAQGGGYVCMCVMYACGGKGDIITNL